MDLADGTNPQEMSQLLGQQGQEIIRSFGQFNSAEPVYSVKDPGSNSNKDYTIQMENIVNQAKNGVHQTGGGMLVKNRPDVETQEEKNALSAENLKQTDPQKMVNDDGGGRNGRLSAVSS